MEYRLEDIFDLQMGKTPSRNIPEYWNSKDNKWISIADLSNCGKYIKETKECLSDCAVFENRISQIPKNTVVMSFKLSIGKTAITTEPMYSNEAIMSFRDKHVVELIPDYIYYMFSYMNWEDGTNKAVMGKTLNKATLSKFKVNIRNIGEQRKIVEILDKVTKIIDDYKSELVSLDELIKARFVEMFGDLRENPRGWMLHSINEMADVITDGEHATPKRTSEGIYLLSARNILNHSLQLNDVDYIDRAEYDRISKRIVPKEGDVLISCSGTVGRCCSVPAGIKFQMVRSAALIRFKKEVLPVFAEYMITSEYIQEQINKAKTASSQANLFKSKIANLKGIMPQLELQNEFVEFVKQIDKSRFVIQKALDEAQLLFDSFMHDYYE